MVAFDEAAKQYGISVHPEVFPLAGGETMEVIVRLVPPAPRNYSVRLGLGRGSGSGSGLGFELGVGLRLGLGLSLGLVQIQG